MEKVFPYGEDLFQRPYIVGFFSCRDPSDYGGRRMQGIPILGSLKTIQVTWKENVHADYLSKAASVEHMFIPN